MNNPIPVSWQTKMKTPFLYLLLLPMITIMGCDSSDKITSTPISEKFTSKPNPYFPSQIGNSWVYYSNTGTEFAIIEKRIVDTLRHTDGTLLYTRREGILGFPNNEYIDYYYGNRDGNIFWYSGATDTSRDYRGTLFPTVKRLIIKDSLFVGQEWTTYDFPNSSNPGARTFHVVSNGDLEVNGVNYTDVYLIQQGSDSLYYARNIGLIKSNILKIRSYAIQNE